MPFKKNNGSGNIYGENIDIKQYINVYPSQNKQYIGYGYCRYLETLLNELIQLDVYVNKISEEEATKRWRGKLKALYGDGHYLNIPVENYEGAKAYLNAEIDKLKQELREEIFKNLKKLFLTEDLIEVHLMVEEKIFK